MRVPIADEPFAPGTLRPVRGDQRSGIDFEMTKGIGSDIGAGDGALDQFIVPKQQPASLARMLARSKIKHCGNCATCYQHRAPHLLGHGGE